MYRSNRNWAVIQLLLRLKAYEKDYPNHMYVVRRSTFISMIFRVVRFIDTRYLKTSLL
jgi:hypothetical protein